MAVCCLTKILAVVWTSDWRVKALFDTIPSSGKMGILLCKTENAALATELARPPRRPIYGSCFGLRGYICALALDAAGGAMALSPKSLS